MEMPSVKYSRSGHGAGLRVRDLRRACWRGALASGTLRVHELRRQAPPPGPPPGDAAAGGGASAACGARRGDGVVALTIGSTGRPLGARHLQRRTGATDPGEEPTEGAGRNTAVARGVLRSRRRWVIPFILPGGALAVRDARGALPCCSPCRSASRPAWPGPTARCRVSPRPRNDRTISAGCSRPSANGSSFPDMATHGARVASSPTGAPTSADPGPGRRRAGSGSATNHGAPRTTTVAGSSTGPLAGSGCPARSGLPPG